MKIRIAGAIASKSAITLYLEDGSEMNLPKDSHRTNEIMQKIAKPLARKKIVELNLSDYSAHAAIERKTGGLIRFMREKVKKVKNFLASSEREGDVMHGIVPLKHDETIVAVVKGKKIPGMEKLERQIEHAAFTKDCAGFQKFMERLADVIDDRGHTVQELLNFMQKGDLPIADDGCIIAYKTLCYHDEENGIFVDKHSRSVKQRIGSRVSMPMKDVDDSRRTQCSTGLHIARRGYFRGYFGDLLALTKIAPEDVIAVPHGDADKIRVMAYHLVVKLPDRVSAIICVDKPMTSDKEAAKILADVVAGDHIGVIEEVVISNEKAKREKGGFHTEKPKEVKIEPVEVVTPFLGAGDNGLAAALDDPEATEVDIRSLNKQIEEVIEEEVDEPTLCDDCEAIIPDHVQFCEDCQDRRDEAEEYDEEQAAVVTKVVDLPKPKSPRKKAAGPTDKPKTDPASLTEAQKKRENAYQAVLGGMSQREAAKQFKVCAKSLRKMVRERAPKAAE